MYAHWRVSSVHDSRSSPRGTGKQWRPRQLRRALGRTCLGTRATWDWMSQRTWNFRENNKNFQDFLQISIKEKWSLPISWTDREKTAKQNSLRKQPTFCETTTGFPVKWRQKNASRNFILTRHQYGMSAFVWPRKMLAVFTDYKTKFLLHAAVTSYPEKVSPCLAISDAHQSDLLL